MKVVAVVPAFNERQAIGEVVRGALPHVASVLVVDDGSTDGTGDAARAAGADVLTLPANQGKGSAVRAGLEQLSGSGATHALLMDGDLQHRPDEIPRLIEAGRATGAALVVGERAFQRDAMPASRYWANILGSRALASLLGVPLSDTQSGFRLLALDAVATLGLCGRGYEIETEMIVKLRRRRARIIGVPVSAVYNGSRSKLRPVRDTSRNVLLAVFYRFVPLPR